MNKQDSRAGRWLALRVLATAACLAVGSPALAATKTYTLDADFALGTLSGVNYTAPNSNQLQLNAVGTTFPVMWIANAGEDTVSKFDTINNVELGRYRTWFGPAGQPGHVNHLNNAYGGPAPSRTAVDLDGNAYVLNRCFNSCGATNRPVLMKILGEGFIDRNGNGVADTSSGPSPLPMGDTNGNGLIDQTEITDERIAWAVPVGDNNGLGRSMCIGTDGNLWMGNYNTRNYYKYSSADGNLLAGPISTTPTSGQPNAGNVTPYGCLIDQNGTLWSAGLSPLLGKIENTASNTGPWTVSSFNAGPSCYGIGLGTGIVVQGQCNRKFDPATNTFSNIGFSVGTYGIVVDGAGDIIGGQTSVQKVSPAGVVQWTAPLQGGGTFAVGIQVDSNNDVWQMEFSTSGRVKKYQGTNGAPLGVFPVGNLPYTYSDASGFAARNVTTPTGTWTVTFDGGAAGSPWGTINWNDLVPSGAAVTVQARSADVEADLASQAYQPVSKNVEFAATGRYIQIQTRLNANTAGDSPILYDLTVASKGNGVCDVNGDGVVNNADLSAIRAKNGQNSTGPGDPFDPNGDGKINVADVRYCQLRLTP